MRRILFMLMLLLVQVSGNAWGQYWLYTVRPGDNIWNVTEEYLSDISYWRRLQALNAIEHPERLPPGDRLRIPIAWLKLQPVAVRVVESHGEVEAVPATGRRIPVGTGLLLSAGDAIRTGSNGSVTLEFGDQSRLSVQSDSYLVLDRVSAYGETGMLDTRLRLEQGRADSRIVRQDGRSSNYEIWTPAAVSAARGTQYRVGVAGPEARTEVVEGTVSVTGAGRTQRTPARFGVLAEVGKPPSVPIPLLPPPAVAGLPSRIERVPVHFQLAPLRGAMAYRVQIAPDAAFETLLFDTVSRVLDIAGPDLPDGNYVLRLRGIDERGLEGLDGYHRFTVKARPEPPFLMEPRPNAIVLERPPTLRWSKPEEAEGYQIQLADNERFERPLILDTRQTATSLTPTQVLSPGWYYWRVATRTAPGGQGPFSDPQRFQLQPATRADAPTIEEDSVIFRWSGTPGQRYRFQLADDPEFTQPLVDVRVTAPQATVAYPPSGIYYLRIKAIEADGREGPYSPTQQVELPPRSYWPYAVFTVLLVLALAL
ncbi:MAG: FecR domain-containing protein [Candidatus Competibacteraceae bacterium]